MNLKIILILIFILDVWNNQIMYSQDNDTIYLLADDNFTNVEEFTVIIKHKLDAISSALSSKSVTADGRIEICFRIDTVGKVDSCSIKKSFRADIDTLFFNMVKELDLKKAAVYDAKGNPHPMYFVLPINVNLP